MSRMSIAEEGALKLVMGNEARGHRVSRVIVVLRGRRFPPPERIQTPIGDIDFEYACEVDDRVRISFWRRLSRAWKVLSA